MLKKKLFFFLILFIFSFLFVIDVSAYGWGFQRKKNAPPNIGFYDEILKDTSSYYLGDTSKNEVLLTFDAGYDNGVLSSILDILQEKKVKASFFITGDFIKRFPELTIRLAKEGHVVCNHSYSHKKIQNMSFEELKEDLKKLEECYFDLTNEQMAKYFRPPEGEFDKESLMNVKRLGYKTVFWSVAYKDWDVKNQASNELFTQKVFENIHSGAIILLHSVSKTNSENLKFLIENLQNDGYSFQTVLSL